MVRPLLIACALVAMWANAAQACPFCASQTENGQTVYYIATALMLGLPVVLVGGLVWWIRAHRHGDDS